MTKPLPICFICEYTIAAGEPYSPIMVMTPAGVPNMIVSHLACHAEVIGSQVARHVMEAIESNRVTSIRAGKHDDGDSLRDTLLELALRALERLDHREQD